jgi:sigma-B regulation protein RsbU (phosphoserine phosphatase)
LFRGGGDAEELGSSRPALGMLPEMTYEESRSTLEPNDAVLFFTDGAFEITDADGSELGPEGMCGLLRDLMSADGDFQVADLEQRLLQFSNEVHLPDDLTLLKLRRRT